MHLKAFITDVKTDVPSDSCHVPKEECVARSNAVCCPPICPLRSIHDKQARPTAWLELAVCPAFMFPSLKLRQKRDEERVRAGRLTKSDSTHGGERHIIWGEG